MNAEVKRAQHMFLIQYRKKSLRKLEKLLRGRRNIPLRAHKESTKLNVLTNSGNFVELLMYRVRGGDKTLENHLQNASRNAKYTFPGIQNDLIECCKDLIMERLAKEVTKSRHY